jgi:hypothetical protein
MVADISNDLIAAFYTQVVNAEDSAALENIRANMATILGNFTFNENPKEQLLTNRQIAAIQESVNNTYGRSLTRTLNERFAGFLEFRDAVNSIGQVLADNFIGKLNKAITDKIKQLQKEVDKNITGLTKEQIYDLMYSDELIKYLPAYKTYNSVDPNNRDGVLGFKLKVVRSANSTVQVITPDIKTRTLDINGVFTEDQNVDSMTGGITEVGFDGPGVGLLINLIHSLDGSLMQILQKKMAIFGVHDAAYIPIDLIDEAAKLMNQIFAEQFRDYSIADVVMERYNQINPEFPDTLRGDLSRESAESALAVLRNYSEAKRTFFALNDSIVIHQFPKEGAAYVLKDGVTNQQPITPEPKAPTQKRREVENTLRSILQEWVDTYLKGTTIPLEFTNDADLTKSAIYSVDKKTIYINKDYILRKGIGQTVIVLSHEFGHALMFNAFDNAPVAVRNKIKQEHKELKDKILQNPNMTVKEFIQLWGSPRTIETKNHAKLLSDYIKETDIKQYPGYLLSFDEYFAEQFARYTFNKKQVSKQPAIQKFWEELYSKLEGFFTKIIGQFGIPVSIEQYFDGFVKQDLSIPPWDIEAPTSENITTEEGGTDLTGEAFTTLLSQEAKALQVTYRGKELTVTGINEETGKATVLAKEGVTKEYSIFGTLKLSEKRLAEIKESLKCRNA